MAIGEPPVAIKSVLLGVKVGAPFKLYNVFPGVLRGTGSLSTAAVTGAKLSYIPCGPKIWRFIQELLTRSDSGHRWGCQPEKGVLEGFANVVESKRYRSHCLITVLEVM